MEQFAIWEGHMDGLMKKVKTIQNKCAKYKCDFHFEQIGEEIREIEDPTALDPITGKPVLRRFRFIIVEAEGTAVINDWEFVASVEHTEKGNIFAKAMTDIEIPDRYRTSDPYCEHCKSRRTRKSTFIVRNKVTGEFKQVGNSCLRDFTFGMSASFAAQVASWRSVFEEAETQSIGSCSWGQKYFSTIEVLRFTAETIRHFGYSKTENRGDSTKDRMLDFFHVCHGDTKFMLDAEVSRIRNLISEVGFDPESEEAIAMADDARNWIMSQEETNDYMHNLKVICSLENTTYSRFGLLVSLFPTYNRDLEYQAQKKAEAEEGKVSEFIGEVGERITASVASVKCLTSWESCYDGYHFTTTYIWKIVDDCGNVFTWKTSNWLNENNPPKAIKGTVKEHQTFREVKQTVLTRCKTFKEALA